MRMRTAPKQRMTRELFRRQGFILIVVLGMTVLVTALGVSFLASNGTAMPAAMNRLAATRARYLAESGVDLGTHYLMYPPTTVTPGGFWSGGVGIAIDATSDFVDVAVIQDLTDPTMYVVTAKGVVHGFDGAVRGKHTVTAKVILPDDNKWHIPYGLLGTSMLIPPTVTVEGDIHANGVLNGQGWCQGNVSAVATATWTGTGPPASVTSSAALYTPPPVDPSLYAAYNIDGVNYTAYIYTTADMGSLDASALNATDMSATNPGRIIVVPPGVFTLKKNVLLTGTLVVAGDLILDDGAVLTAVADFPALVVTGDIRFEFDNVAAQVVGSVLCGGAIDDGAKTGAALAVTGACILSSGFATLDPSSAIVLTWDPDRSVFWNLAESDRRKPITVLSWKEN